MSSTPDLPLPGAPSPIRNALFRLRNALFRQNQSLIWLALLAGGMIALVSFLAFRYPILPGLANPRATWSTLVEPGWANGIQHILVYLGLTLVYGMTLHVLTRRVSNTIADTQAFVKLQRRQVARQVALIVIAWLVCSSLLLTVSPAGESHDIFDYLFRGRMMAEYKGNPLVQPPVEFDLTPYYRYTAWKKLVDAYGPVWELSSAAVSVGVRQFSRLAGWWVVGFQSCPKSPESCRLLVAYLTAYRLLAIGLTGISAAIIFSLVKHTKPSLAPAALAAWLWCPLTLVAVGIGGHNDAGMIAILLIGVWLLQRLPGRGHLQDKSDGFFHPEREGWKFFILAGLAVVAFILAAHIKLTALVWLPAILLWLVKGWGWRRSLLAILAAILAGILTGLLLSWLLYQPFDGWGTLTRNLHERTLYLANSPWKIFNYLLDQWGLSKTTVQQLTVNLPTALFALSAILVPLWMFNFRPKRWRKMPEVSQKADETLWSALLVISLLFLLIGTYWFQHWYIQWVVWPAALLPASRFTRHVLPWLVFGGLAANFSMDFYLAIVQPGPSLANYSLAVAITWGPALIAGLALWIRSPKQPQG